MDMAGATSLKSLNQNPSSCPCSYLDSIPSSRLYVIAASKNKMRRNQLIKKLKMVDLSSSFLQEQRFRAETLSRHGFCSRKRSKKITIVDELGGQYEDTFNDVKMELINYFTFKAVRTVLEQLYEMNPPQYTWLHNFVADNVPNQGKRFLQILVKERRELAERVMVTRLTLYGRWIKKLDHGEIYQEISDENLKLLRERLLETIVWPSDDNSTDQKTTDHSD